MTKISKIIQVDKVISKNWEDDEIIVFYENGTNRTFSARTAPQTAIDFMRAAEQKETTYGKRFMMG